MATDMGRPTSGDVVDLILDDHRLFEDALRRLRDSSQDRDQARRELAELHVAHALAEESEVYPTLRRRDAISEHEEEHGEEEHAEGHRALLAVLRAAPLDGEEFDDLLEELSAVLTHHLVEEELSILNPARADIDPITRRRLGAAFCTRRNELLDRGCGELEDIERLVSRARGGGLLDD